MKVSFTSQVFDFCFFCNSLSSIRTGFKMYNFPGYSPFCRFVSSRIMSLDPIIRVFGLTNVISVQRGGKQYVNNITVLNSIHTGTNQLLGCTTHLLCAVLASCVFVRQKTYRFFSAKNELAPPFSIHLEKGGERKNLATRIFKFLS